MSGVRRVLFGLVFFSFFPSAGFLSAGSEEQRSWISALLEVLSAIYDYDTSQIPDEPNEIFALRNSPSSRDQMAWALLNWLRMELDPNSRPYVEAIYPETALFSANEPTGSPDSLPKVETTALQENPELVEIVGIRTLGGESEPIEELAGPLGSCILEPKTYRITSLPVRIEGYVVIPAGTRLIAPYDPNLPVIEVMPGGRLDLGRAAFYEGDCPAVLPAVRIEAAESNNWFVNNAAGIYVHRGADPKTRIENLIITHCTAGIVLNETLETPLRWVIAVGCFDGLQLYAPAAVQDCEFWLNGSIFYGLLGYVGTGIYVVPDISSFPAFTVEIERTILYEGDIGLYIDEPWTDPNTTDPNTSDPNQLPEVRIRAVNSCFANSYFFGIYQRSGLTEAEIVHSAFWGNRRPVNFEGSFPGCIGLMADPLYNFPQEWEKLYILPDSELTDAGYGMADDGTGTAHDRPDTGILDIGCHFPVGVTGTFGIPSSPADFNWDGVVDEQDLALMEACMGATDDPNRVRMDLNADSWVNLPDFGIFATDYGYTADPNQPGLHDPNCARSDFSGDGMVNLEDLAIAAEHWLTAVFDEGRLCGLCNLYKDPNTPPGRQTIDDRDRNAFWAEWGKVYASDPNILIEQEGGRVWIGIGQPQPAWRISAFLDGEQIGQWDDWQLESPVFNADLITLGPGNHLLKIVRNIQNGLEITEWNLPDSNPIGLYYAEIPESFEPNLPVEVRGLNPHNKSFLITFANDLTSQVVETQTISDAAVRLGVPGSILGDTFASVSLKDTDGDEEIVRSLTKPFDPNDWRHKKPRAVIICPDTHWNNYYDLFELRRRAILAAARVFVNREIDYCVLYKKDVTPENLQCVLGNRSVRYVYWVGHGNCYVGNPKIEEPIPRTSLSCWIKNKKVPAFSFTRRTIPYAPPLLTATGNNYDEIGFDLNSITIDGRPMREAGTKRLVVIDACSGCKTMLPDGSGRYDMAWVFGAYNYQPHLPLTDQMNYIGWSIEVNASGGTIFQDDTTDRLKDFWEVLGSGNTLAAAYERIWNNSATASSSATLLPTFFGPDEINQYGKGDDHFKREGGGIKEQKLENR